MQKVIGVVIITILLSGNLFAGKYINEKRVYLLVIRAGFYVLI